MARVRVAFRDALDLQWQSGNFIAVRLDAQWTEIPRLLRRGSIGDSLRCFLMGVVDRTKYRACVFIMYPSSYLRYGEEGTRVLQEIIEHIHSVAPDVPVILDGRYGGDPYAANFAFGCLKADAVTVDPYEGISAIQQFLAGEWKKKGIFVVCRTSSSGELQDTSVGSRGHAFYPAFKYVAEWISELGGNCGLVMNEAHPQEVRAIRKIAFSAPLLITGPDLESLIASGCDSSDGGIILDVFGNAAYSSTILESLEGLDARIRAALAKPVQILASRHK